MITSFNLVGSSSNILNVATNSLNNPTSTRGVWGVTISNTSNEITAFAHSNTGCAEFTLGDESMFRTVNDVIETFKYWNVVATIEE